MKPLRPQHFRHNPLLDVRRGKHEVRDVRKLSRYLVASRGPEGERSQYFQAAATELIAAGVLHTLYVGSSKTLAAVEALFSDRMRSAADLLESMRGKKHLGDRVHPFVARAVDDQLRREERAQSAVLALVRRHLIRFRELYDGNPDLFRASVNRVPTHPAAGDLNAAGYRRAGVQASPEP
jgi:type IV secretion system protein VirD4